MSTPPPAKRARLSASATTAPASKSIQDAITALASSSSDLCPALYTSLLGSLATAHTRALDQEQDAPDVKPKQEEPREREGSASNHNFGTSTPLRSWISTIQGEITEMEKAILNDIEAGMPKLDELGILIRPFCTEGKLDLRKWAVAIPGRAGTEWDGCLFKGFLIFPAADASYPARPKFQTDPPLFHPNAYASGTLGPGFNPGDESFDWPTAGDGMTFESVPCRGGNGEIFANAFPTFKPELRLPLLLNGCRRIIHFPQLNTPSGLEAYTMAKKDPAGYAVRQQEEAKKHRPTHQDLLDLAEAQRRVEQRKRNQS